MDRIVMRSPGIGLEINRPPPFQAYEVPLTRERAVLDGLTYIMITRRNTLLPLVVPDGYCGSSGMTINGDPKLACATSCRLPTRAGAVEPMRFPGAAISLSIISDFMAAFSVSRGSSGMNRPSKIWRIPADPGRSSSVSGQFSMCINCMLCYSARLRTRWTPDFLGPAAIALGQRYNLDLARPRCGDVLAAADGAWAHLVGECSTVIRKASILPARSSAADRGHARALKKVVPLGADERHRQPVERYWWGRRFHCDSCFAKSVA